MATIEPMNYAALMQQSQQPQIMPQQTLDYAKLGQVIGQRMAMQKMQQQQNADFGAYFQNPTSESASRLMLKYPKIATQIKEAWSMEYGKQAENKEQFVTQAYHALNSGNNKLAANMFRERAQGYENKGDTEKAKMWNNYADMAENEPQNAKAMGGLLLSSVIGPEKFGKLITATQKTPAEAGKFVAETEEIKAKTRKLNEEIKAMKAPTGQIPIDKRPEAEGKLRKEYFDNTKSFRDIRDAYGRIVATEDNAAGDLALIFNYMKMLDPGSVVREGEFATAQNAAGVPDRIRNFYNNAISGERLNPNQRKMFLGQSKKLYRAAEQQEKKARTGIGRIAKNYGLNINNIFFEPGGETIPTSPNVQQGSTTHTQQVQASPDVVQSLLKQYGTPGGR